MAVGLPIIRYNGPRGYVAVRQGLQGHQHDYCLCTHCDKFVHSDTPNGNCPIAEDLKVTARRHGVMPVIWECPDFTAKADTLERCTPTLRTH